MTWRSDWRSWAPRTRCSQLPSTGTDPALLGDLTADARYVRRTLDAIDEPVVLVGHSYSGMVITEFADHPKVRHSVYLSALWPERGQSALNLVGDVLPPVFTRRDDGALEVTDDFEFAWRSFCADLDQDRAQKVLLRFVLQSYSSFAALSTAPDRSHPTTYVIGLARRTAQWRVRKRGRRRGSRRSIARRPHDAAFAARRVGRGSRASLMTEIC